MHFEQSLEYYLSIDNASLGLIWTQLNQSDQSAESLTNRLLQKYSQQLIQSAIRNGDWKHKFKWLFTTIESLNQLWNYELHDYVK